MTISLRQAAVFASGLLLGAAAAAWFVMGAHPSRSSGNKPIPDVAMQPAAVAPRPLAEAAAPTTRLPPVSTVESRQRTECPSEAVTRIARNGDGLFTLQSNVSARTASDFGAFVLAGKEAAAAGHPHDAEVAFLMACRVADKVKGIGSIESADAKYQLGRHYANVALAGGAAAGANRSELLRRAELLYSDSLEAYHVKYGDGHEKSRFAAAGLASVLQQSSPTARTVEVAPVPLPRPPVRVAAAPVPTFSAEPVTRAATGSATSDSAVRPSFDCGKARSRPEKIICSDAELARLDHELGRLYARAKVAAPDGAAFRRQNDQEWRRRESTCRDRECLLQWYAQRREQLMNEVQ